MPKTFNLHVLEIMRRFEGIGEMPGPSDNELIVLAHRVSGITGKSSVDEIPWCASGLNLCIILANIERNPSVAYSKITTKFGPEIARRLFALVGKYKLVGLEDTGLRWIDPTYSAMAASFDTIGKFVPESEMQEGDFIRFTRDGGGHIAMYLGKTALYYRVFGANQDNKFCASEKYLKSRFVTARRIAA